MNNKNPRIILKILTVIIVILVGWQLRDHAVNSLNVDYDEDDYMRAAQEFNILIRDHDWVGFLETNYRQEHPPLAKILMGVGLLAAPETELLPDRPTSAEPDQSIPREQLISVRTTNSIFGILTVLAMAVVDPIGGFFLAIHSFTIKYVSEVMLEAVPALFSLLCVISYSRWKTGKKKNIGVWLVVSAIMLGLTAASKYIYCVAGIAILIDWYFSAKQANQVKGFVRNALIWGALAFVAFFVFNPYLWPDPLGRIKESLLYHSAYSTGAAEVISAGFPIWQPLVWLNTTPKAWQPDSILIAIDPLITIFAIIGLKELWKNNRVYAIWIVVSLFFLFLWPTKWPQYIVILTAPLSFAASKGVSGVIINPAISVISQWKLSGEKKPVKQKWDVRKALPWLILGVLVFAIFTLLPLLFQFAVSLTNFNSISIRDGLQGGIWREVWGGLTGQVNPVEMTFPARNNTVQFTALKTYLPVIDYLTGQGILVFNILWTVLSVLLQTILGVGVAMILWQRGLFFKKGWEVLFILPWAIPEMIGALMWFNVFAPETGWLALAVQTYGKTFPLAFLLEWVNDGNIRLVVLLISGVWYGFPFILLVSSACLKFIPVEVYDAAAIDGANFQQTFINVTWPMLKPLIIPAIIIRGIFAFNQFYLFQAFYFMDGTLATLSYNFFNPSGYFMNGQFAVSAVINILTIFFIFGFVLMFNRWSKAGEGLDNA